jgi:predicted CopG family antitoxin
MNKINNEIQKQVDEKSVHAVILYLTHRKEALSSIINPLLEQKKSLLTLEDPAFHSDIEKEFETIIRREIAEQIALEMTLDPEQIFLVVETLDVPSFISSLKNVGEENE